VIGLAALVAVVGTLAERTFGTARWVVLFVVGALAGHVIGEWWQPYSSGISVGFCGPLGALVGYALLAGPRNPPQRLVGPALVLVGAVVLTVLTDIHGPAILAGAVVGVLFVRFARNNGTIVG
jgi:rhomboid protease GluP